MSLKIFSFIRLSQSLPLQITPACAQCKTVFLQPPAPPRSALQEQKEMFQTLLAS